jgi:hypothetical protein
MGDHPSNPWKRSAKLFDFQRNVALEWLRMMTIKRNIIDMPVVAIESDSQPQCTLTYVAFVNACPETLVAFLLARICLVMLAANWSIIRDTFWEA